MLSPHHTRAGNQEIVDGYLNPQKVFEALELNQRTVLL